MTSRAGLGLRLGFDEERHRARVRCGLSQEQQPLRLLRRRSLRPDGRHDQRRLLVPPGRRRPHGGTGCPDSTTAANGFSRRARERRHLRLRRVRGRRRRRPRSRSMNGSVARSLLSLLFDEERRQLLQPGGHDLRQDEPGLIDVPWTYSDNQGTAAGKITTGGFFEGGIDLSAIYQGLRQGSPCVNEVPRHDRQLPPGHRRSRGLRRWQLATSVRSSSSTRSPPPPVTRRNSPFTITAAKRIQPVTVRSPTAIRPSTVAIGKGGNSTRVTETHGRRRGS